MTADVSADARTLIPRNPIITNGNAKRARGNAVDAHARKLREMKCDKAI